MPGCSQLADETERPLRPGNGSAGRLRGRGVGRGSVSAQEAASSCSAQPLPCCGTQFTTTLVFRRPGQGLGQVWAWTGPAALLLFQADQDVVKRRHRLIKVLRDLMV